MQSVCNLARWQWPRTGQRRWNRGYVLHGKERLSCLHVYNCKLTYSRHYLQNSKIHNSQDGLWPMKPYPTKNLPQSLIPYSWFFQHNELNCRANLLVWIKTQRTASWKWEACLDTVHDVMDSTVTLIHGSLLLCLFVPSNGLDYTQQAAQTHVNLFNAKQGGWYI